MINPISSTVLSVKYPFYHVFFSGEITRLPIPFKQKPTTSGTLPRALGSIQMTWALTLGVWEALGIELPFEQSSINGSCQAFDMKTTYKHPKQWF